MVTFLGSLVQLCCGEGGTLQANITIVCRECSQYFSCTGFAPAHGVCAFMVYTSQALSCSAGNCLRRALACMLFPGLSGSGSGPRVLHKRTDLVGPALCAPQVGGVSYHLPYPSHSVFWMYNGCSFSVVPCLFWGVDLWLQPFWLMSTIQNPKKSWLALRPACSLVEDASLGP